MAQPFLGEIRVVSFNFAPKGWALCNGQLLPINQNQALFSILGTTFGGNGQTTFALPDFRGRVPVHFGQGISLGEAAGAATHTLTTSELPMHNHAVAGSSAAPSARSAASSLWASNAASPYAATPTTVMHPASIAATGGNQAHDNMPPYLVLHFVIALQGIFPSRN